MRLFTKPRVVKGNTIEIEVPRVIECPPDQFVKLTQKVGRLSFNDFSHVTNEGSDGEQSESIANLLSDEEVSNLASGIIAQAEENSREIVQKGIIEAEQLKQEVEKRAEEEIYPQAREKGFQEGFNKGLAEANEIKIQVAQTKEEAKKLWELAQRAVQEEFVKVDEELLGLALKISERIVRAQLNVEPQHLLEQIRGLSLLPQERSGWVLHLSPSDKEWLNSLSPEDQFSFPCIADETLTQGDCYLECTEGLFDARLQSQLDKLELFLQEELKHGGVEPADRKPGTD